MGYTHYWQQKKSFSKRTWKEVCADVTEILKNVVEVQGVPLADGNVEGLPVISSDLISVNGIEGQFREGFVVRRERPETQSYQKPHQRGWDFTKTAREPYDIAVTACMIYLSSIHPTQFPSVEVTSDGTGWNWLAGLDVAKQALSRYGNQFDIPLGIRQDDRWVYLPSFGINDSDYRPRACVNGKVYVFWRNIAMHAFASIDEYTAWAKTEMEALRCSYSSPLERPKNNARQNGAFKRLLMKHQSASLDDIPVFVRPNSMIKFDPSLLTNAPANSFEEAI